MAEEMDRSLSEMIREYGDQFTNQGVLCKFIAEARRLEHGWMSDRQFLLAALQLLKEHDVNPSSGDLLAAYKRTQSDG